MSPTPEAAEASATPASSSAPVAAEQDALLADITSTTGGDATTPLGSAVECPLSTAGYLSMITFWWANGLIRLGSQKVLQAEDVWQMPRHDDTQACADAFNAAWASCAAEATAAEATPDANTVADGSATTAAATATATTTTAVAAADNDDDSDKTAVTAAAATATPCTADCVSDVIGHAQPRLWRVLYVAYGRPAWWVGGLCHALSVVSNVSMPLFFKNLIQFLTSYDDDVAEADRETVWHGYAYAGGLVLCTVFSTHAINSAFFVLTRMANRIRSGLIVALVAKVLKLNSTARQSSTQGEMVNLMSNDAQRVFEGVILVHFLWLGPLQMLAALSLIINEVGVAALAGLVVMLLLVPVQLALAKRLGITKRRMLTHTDERVKLMSEVLQGIRVVKLYAWEESLRRRIAEVRASEVTHLASYLYKLATLHALLFMLPVIIAFFTIMTYSLMGNSLTVTKVFTVLAYINIMRYPIALMAVTVNALTECSVALRRLERFFRLPELPSTNFITVDDDVETGVNVDPVVVDVDDDDNVNRAEDVVVTAGAAATAAANRGGDNNGGTDSSSSSANLVISVTNGEFRWSADANHPPTLTNIHFHVPRGALVAIVGTVGAGKSSLLSALLAEMNTVADDIYVRGRVAYTSQESWITNATLRDNILFGLPFDRCRYHDAIDAAQLAPDIDVLPDRDATMIGERGINLSGGQKARVSMARALYRRQERDVYLFDDPFSAVDTRVGANMFEKGIRQSLRGKTRVLVLSSHLHLLQYVDRIFIVGSIEDAAAAETAAAGGEICATANTNTDSAADGGSGAAAAAVDDVMFELDADNHAELDASTLQQHGRGGNVVVADAHDASHGSAKSTMSAGSIIASGTLDELRNGRFAALLNTITDDDKSVIGSVDEVVPGAPVVATADAAVTAPATVARSASDNNSTPKRDDDNNNDIVRVANGAADDSCGASGKQQKMTDDTGNNDDDKEVVGKKLYQAEDRVEGAVSLKTFFYFFNSVLRSASTAAGDAVAAGQKPSLVAGIALTTLLMLVYASTQVMRVMADMWLGWWSEERFFEGYDDWRFWLMWYAVIVVVAFALSLSRTLLFQLLSLRASYNIHEKAFTSLLRAPVPMYFDVTPVGRIINRFSKDTDQVDLLLPNFMAQVLQNGWILFASLIVCMFSMPVFVAVLLPIFFCFYKIQRYFRMTSRELKRLEGISRSPVYSSFAEMITGLSSIRAYQVQQRFIDRNNELCSINGKMNFANYMVQRWLAVRLDWVSLLIVSSVSFLAVGLREDVDVSVAALAILYALGFTGLLQWLVRTYIETENHLTAVERMGHFSTIPHERAAHVPATDPPADWPLEGAIEIRHLSMRYRPELDLVLRNVSCSIRGREKIGICGRTGSGKSSLMLALFRIVEAESVTAVTASSSSRLLPGTTPAEAAAADHDEDDVDIAAEDVPVIAIDGVDISTIGLDRLRRSLSIIPQDPVLFSGDIRYNLDPFNECTDAQLMQALRRVHLYEYVATLDGGLAYTVAEHGENMSHGQRQLLCIARALLRRSRIIVMDEATSSVDAETDALIQQTVRENFADCTVLTIAHRLDSILDADRVLVLGAGRVLEFDAPDTLLARTDSHFYQMVHTAHEREE